MSVVTMSHFGSAALAVVEAACALAGSSTAVNSRPAQSAALVNEVRMLQ
ncbi:hypothetical protein [Allokutzneria sp. NRRL B-24872]|nr:hypothetical protein [Allokutzneria sp. NRRL B-24872]